MQTDNYYRISILGRIMEKNVLTRIYWRLLREIGLVKLSWDKQFKARRWCQEPLAVHTIKKVIELCDGGHLMEFGAGEGVLPRSLPNDTFSHYTGYDISEVAIQRAKEQTNNAGLTNCDFKQCDMAEWSGDYGVNLIVAEECLYYLSPKKTELFLKRCCESLAPDGNILVIVHCGKKHSQTLAICKRVCQVKDEFIADGRTFLTLTPNHQLQIMNKDQGDVEFNSQGKIPGVVPTLIGVLAIMGYVDNNLMIIAIDYEYKIEETYISILQFIDNGGFILISSPIIKTLLPKQHPRFHNLFLRLSNKK